MSIDGARSYAMQRGQDESDFKLMIVVHIHHSHTHCMLSAHSLFSDTRRSQTPGNRAPRKIVQDMYTLSQASQHQPSTLRSAVHDTPSCSARGTVK